jgi:hypothetical protein
MCGRPSVAPGRSSPAWGVPNSGRKEATPHSEEARPIRAAHRPVRRPHRRRPRVPAVPGRRGPRRPGPGQTTDHPAALAVRRRPAHEAEGGLLQLTPLGREFLDLPDAAQLGFVFASCWVGVDWGDWAPRPSWDACSGTSATPCSRSSPACPPARSTWPPSPAASGPWSAGPPCLPTPTRPSGARLSGRPPWPPWPCWAPSTSRPACPHRRLVRPHRHHPGPARRRHVRPRAPSFPGLGHRQLAQGPRSAAGPWPCRLGLGVAPRW